MELQVLQSIETLDSSLSK
uniref:Uncharacterized protein n=1 Tax=Arundo donax TaxID=35708 RepID=A0A0A9A782_ARUDO